MSERTTRPRRPRLFALELYASDERLIATLGVVHGAALRWTDAWPGDARLAKADEMRLCQWLAQHGAEQPLADLLAAEARERAKARKLAMATRGFSDALRAAFIRSDAAFSEELERSYPELGTRLGVLLQVLGASNESWSSFMDREVLVDKLLKASPVTLLAEVCHTALLGEHRVRRRGAARLWTGWQSPLENHVFEDPAALWRVVLDAQQEARYQPLRVEAAARLASMTLRGLFSEHERDRRLLKLMRDPDANVRRRAMLAAGVVGSTAAVPLLMAALEGKPVEHEPLAPVPEEEEADVATPFPDVVCGGCPENEVAALALAYVGHQPAKATIATLTSTPLLDVALALFGDLSKLRPEHFGVNRPRLYHGNQQLQLAAVETVVRCRGRVGLAWALQYERVSHWWEKQRVAEKLAAMLREEDAPDSAALAGCTSLEVLGDWFERHGAAYLSRG